MRNFTKAEAQSIKGAFASVEYLCSATNQSDSLTLETALKYERKQCSSLVHARALVCKMWLEGMNNPDQSVRNIYWIRQGCLQAYMLGVRHNIERKGESYSGKLVEDAMIECAPIPSILNAIHTS